MKRLGKLGHCLSLIAGSAIGTACFLFLCALLVGGPVRDTIFSAHGILTANKPATITESQKTLILELVQNGSLVSSNDLLTSMTSYYSAMIQALIALFFVFGTLSFFVVQAHSSRQVEEAARDFVPKETENYFASLKFDHLIKEKIDVALQIELEDLEERLIALERSAEQLNEIERRLNEIQNTSSTTLTEE